MNVNKLTEDETVEILMAHLEVQNWTIESYCLGYQRGVDIVAVKDEVRMYVEAKGAKGNPNASQTTRKHFDSGQIKDHLGKAIVKSLETQNEFPNALVAIAHPDDKYIRKVIGGLIKNINKTGIIHFWVSENGDVKKEA